MSTHKWAALSAVSHLILGTASTPTAKNLANDGQKCSSEYDNTSNLYQYMDLMQLCRGASAFSAGGYVEVYLLTAIDGSTYQDGADDSTAPPASALVHVFPLRAVSTQQRIEKTNIWIPPTKFKLVIINKGGQAFTNTDAENLLDAYFHNEQDA